MNRNWEKFLNIVKNPFSLTLVSALGYFATYQYQVGYLSYYGIPAYFVDISIPNIIATIFILTGLSMTIVPLFDDMFSKPIETEKDFLVVIITLTLFVGFLTQFVENFNINKNIFTVLLVVWLAVTLFYLKSKGFRSLLGWISSMESDSFLRRNFGLSVLSVLTLFIFLVIVSNTISKVGYLMAKKLTSYNTIEIDKNLYAIVSNKGDNVLIMPIDIKEKVIRKKLYIQKTEDLTSGGNGMDLRRQDLRVE